MTYGFYLDLVHPDDRARVDETVRAAFLDGQSFAMEYRVMRPDGAERIVSSRGRVLLDGSEPVAMVGTGQDVTEQRQAETLREDILSAVSHELRTPLTAVLGFALTLERRRDLPEATVDGIVDELGRAARRLDRLLVDLLDLERDRRGLAVLRREPTDIQELLRRVVEATPLDGRPVELKSAPIRADVDAAKLERIVENLVANAVKHTPPGSSIAVRAECRGTDLVLVVDDEGPGVADEFKAAVFETFNRGPSVLSATPGTGIGLSLVARFTAAHGGRSWVEDRPGGGASFHVLLPGCILEVREPEAAVPPSL